jgi:hypothetical protein
VILNLKVKKIVRFFIYILFLFFAIIFFDLTLNLVLPEKFKKSIGISKNYSLKSERFHHEISSNINVYEFWGDRKYKVITNNHGMRVENNNPLDKGKKNIGFIGDSFVYGSGISFKNHFINYIEKHNTKHNYLNLGYVSYSPSIYYKKLDYYINEKNIDFKKIIVFVDTSDIQDEGIFYREDKKGNIVRKWNSDREIQKRNFKYVFKNYLKQNSFIFKFYEIFYVRNNHQGPTECLVNKNIIKNFKKYLDYERFGYAFDNTINSKDWVKLGQNKTLNYLSKIKSLLDENETEMVIIYYPSAIDILENNKIKENSKHYNLLYTWSKNNNVNLIDTHEDFFKQNDPIKNYKINHIICDAHWNENGHKIIGKNILNYIKN